ncbi:NnrS family protein [bacterium]|nr:NnrS family protein [bacterium]
MPSDRPRSGTPPVLELGFRPFFLLAGAAALALIAAWLAALRGALTLPVYYDAITWHGHEMVFGYTAAVVAGFLLTAVRNWTGVATPRGAALAGLAALWLAGRVAPLLPGLLPGWLIAGIDLAFLPALAAALAGPLLAQPRASQLVFLPLLLALAAANALVHLQMLGRTGATARPALYAAVDVVVLIIAVVGGRVLPFFTERAVAAAPRRHPPLEAVVWASTAGVLVIDALGLPATAAVPVCAVGALAHALRLAGWYDRRIWRVPLLWVLHLGYAWVAIGFALKAAVAAALVIPMVGLHALTVGAIGVLTLGMMARVALGHTGRALQATPAMAVAFALINAAAAVRALAAAALPTFYAQTVLVAGGLWLAAFAIFGASYAGILVRPRLDGRGP